MRSEKILEMLDNGKIEDLKAALQDEIYTESLKKKPDAKKRYSAMKKYFTYCDSGREILQKPCEVERLRCVMIQLVILRWLEL